MKPYIWAIFTAVVWGTVPIVEKAGLIRLPVWAGLFYRCIGVFIGFILIVIFKFNDIRQVVITSPFGWHYPILGGFLASIIGQIFFYNALKTGEASKVVPLAGTYPLVSFLLGVMFFHEGITIAKIAGVVFIILGVFLLR